MKFLTSLGLACLPVLLPLLLWAQNQDASPRKFTLPPALEEVSGLIVESPGRFWWHNDSGNTPSLYQTDAKGSLLREVHLPSLPNKDWEDLTADPSGKFYIGDFGNNCNCRKDLRIFLYEPATGTLDSILFSLEDQQAFPPSPPYRNFDLEGFLWHADSLHLFSKNTLKKGNYFTKHYVLPAIPGKHVAMLRDSVFLKNRVVTAAAISPDRQEVALLSYRFSKFLGIFPHSNASVFFLRDFPSHHFLQGTRRKQKVAPCFLATQLEAIDFLDADTVLIASEKTLHLKPRAKRVKVR